MATGKTELLYEHLLASGFLILAEDPGREEAGGEIGQMWKPDRRAPEEK